jgi:hypothetical protein
MGERVRERETRKMWLMWLVFKMHKKWGPEVEHAAKRFI